MKTVRALDKTEIQKLEESFKAILNDDSRMAIKNLFAMASYLFQQGNERAAWKALKSSLDCLKLSLALKRRIESNFHNTDWSLSAHIGANVEFLDLLKK